MSTASENVTPIRTPAKRTRVRASVPESAVSVRLPQMAEMLGIGLTKAQSLVKSGAVQSTLIGKTRLISVRSIKALVNDAAA